MSEMRRGVGRPILDQVDTEILYNLRDGRMPFRALADRLGVSENTIRSRVKKLEDESILQIAGLVDPEYLPGVHAAFVALRTDPQRVLEIAEAARKLKGVGVSACVTGRFNIILYLMTDQDYTLTDFLQTELPTIPGITEVEVSPVYKGYNLQSRYVL